MLSEKISRLQRSGEEYIAALEQFIDTLGKRGLEHGDVQSHSRLALGQVLFDRRQEEAETIQQAEAHVERPERLEDVEDDDVSGDQEEKNTPTRIKQTTQDFLSLAHVQQPSTDQRHQARQAGHPEVQQPGPETQQLGTGQHQQAGRKQVPMANLGGSQFAVLDPSTLEAIIDFKLSSMDLSTMEAILVFWPFLPQPS